MPVEDGMRLCSVSVSVPIVILLQQVCSNGLTDSASCQPRSHYGGISDDDVVQALALRLTFRLLLGRSTRLEMAG